MRSSKRYLVARFDPLAGATRQYLALAASLFLASFAIGALISQKPPGNFELAEFGQYGVATPLAEFLTAAGRFPVYFALGIASLVFGFVKRDWLSRAIVSVVLLIAVWQTSDLMKVLFHRARPMHPIIPETTFGYPSGHADQAIAFFGYWAFWIWKSDLPKPTRLTIVIAFALWTLAIGWSRIALGAHFAGDVLGGYLFGAGWVGIGIVVSAEFVRRAAAFHREMNTLGVRISRR